jgi:FKBP-type peptidyl-prolyl cis-trans isomerase
MRYTSFLQRALFAVFAAITFAACGNAAPSTPTIPANCVLGGPEKEITMPTGLKYADLLVCQGQEAKTGDSVSMHYTGWLTNGSEFDSSRKSGQPIHVVLGSGGVIRGWELGIPGMKVGSKRRLIIPPSLGYGPQGSGSIPPNATLVFDVELVSIP